MGSSVRESARRILELCKDKEKLKKERADAKKLRTKIVGAGNTMDSYGDKFLSAPNDVDARRDGPAKDGFARPANPYSTPAERDGMTNFNSIGSYDPYSSNKPLSEKIGVILGDVDKIKEGDKPDVIKQKLATNGSRKFAYQAAADNRRRLPQPRRADAPAAQEPADCPGHERQGLGEPRK